ncbi:MAG TPA: response regulator transcription factor [Opitutales bacterium]|nr:response regulator transcription factor [Opitutales bacterium]
MKRVVIIEDETMLRDLLAELLKNFPLCTLAGTFGDGMEGWKGLQKIKPDMAVLDIKLPSLNGLEILRRLREQLPNCNVLLFSAYFTTGMVRQALKAGANGIIEKTAGLPEMEKAIRAVLDGGTYLGPGVADMVRRIMIEPDKDDSLESLSEREREVLQFVAEGFSTKEIAVKLSISVKTAETHRSNLMTKLNLHGIAGLTRYAIEHGLIKAAQSNPLSPPTA